MQQIEYTSGLGPDGLYFAEGPEPVPEPDEVRVKVAATSLNRADLLQRQGKYPPPAGASPILGLEMAGTVASLGSEVSHWQVGDRVCGLLAGGGYAQYACIHEALLFPVPENLSFAEAAAIPEVFLTAFQALRFLADVQAGERVLLHAGASGVGTAAIQLCRLMGAEAWVTASAAKHARCLELGARRAIDYTKEDFEAVIERETEGEGVNVIVDPVGAPYFGKNLNILQADGRLIHLAFMGGAKVKEASLAPLLAKRLTIIGTTLRSRSLPYKVRLSRAFHDFAWSYFADGTLKPVIDSVLPWREVQQAHQMMEANRNTGKIVLQVAH